MRRLVTARTRAEEFAAAVDDRSANGATAHADEYAEFLGLVSQLRDIEQPVLRPGQTVKIALPDKDEMLRLTAHVAWSMFQQTKQGTTVYRAGVAFTDAAQETLDDYCRRYGAENPLPSF